VLCREPFRLFFPLGILLAWGGVGHWLTYAIGITTTYSCTAHALVQVQGFLLSFATGFLFTAIPRRTQSAPPSSVEVGLAAALLVVGAAAALDEASAIAETATLGIMALLVGFALRRFVRASSGRRPPAAFVLVPAGFVQGAAGALLVAGAVDLGTFGLRLGRLLLEQGLLLSLVAGVGGLVLPLMAGAAPPADIGSSPREARRAAAYAVGALGLLVTFVAEAAGSERAAPLARAVLVAAALGLGAGAWRRPRGPGWNRRVAWLAVWLTPLGVALSGLVPDYRVPALHVTFIGGFGLLAVAVATHVTASHLELRRLRDGRSTAIAFVAGAMLVALAGRLTADATHTYFEHLGASALVWMVGSGVWLVVLMPHWVRRS
jgi:uncharacterized protein involved in response to NO